MIKKHKQLHLKKEPILLRDGLVLLLIRALRLILVFLVLVSVAVIKTLLKLLVLKTT